MNEKTNNEKNEKMNEKSIPLINSIWIPPKNKQINTALKVFDNNLKKTKIIYKSYKNKITQKRKSQQ